MVRMLKAALLLTYGRTPQSNRNPKFSGNILSDNEKGPASMWGFDEEGTDAGL
jgi:hypothetical protein